MVTGLHEQLCKPGNWISWRWPPQIRFCWHVLTVWPSFWMSFWFINPSSLPWLRDVPFRKRFLQRLLPVMCEPWCIEQSLINCVLNLVTCLWQVSSVTVFIWMRLIFHSFDFACLGDIPFRKRLVRSSYQEGVNPVGSSTQWLAPFWLFEFALDLFRLKRSLFEWAYFSSHLILQA